MTFRIEIMNTLRVRNPNFYQPIVFICLFLYFTSCKSKSETNESAIEFVNVANAILQNSTINISQIAESIEYVQLETTPNSLVDKGLRTYINNEYIITVSFLKILLFDRYSGKFIREIGGCNKGPLGYQYTLLRENCYNSFTNTIIAQSLNDSQYNAYNLNGKIESKIEAKGLQIETIGFLDKKRYVGFIRNYDGVTDKKLAIFNNDSIIKKFDNYQSFQRDGNAVISWPGCHGWFYNYNNNLNFFELFTDTIFRITDQALEPRYVFNMGKFAPDYQKQMSIEFIRKERANYFFITDIIENDNFLLFTVFYNRSNYFSYYDKNKKISYASNAGYINDLDNFVPFQPSTMYNEKFLVDG